MYRCCLGGSLLRNGNFGRGIWSIRCIGGGGIFCRSFFRLRRVQLGQAVQRRNHPAERAGCCRCTWQTDPVQPWAPGAARRRCGLGSRAGHRPGHACACTGRCCSRQPKSHPAKARFRCQNLPLRHRDPPTGRQAVPPGESPLVPHSAAAAFQRACCAGVDSSPTITPYPARTSLRSKARLPQQAQQGNPQHPAAAAAKLKLRSASVLRQSRMARANSSGRISAPQRLVRLARQMARSITAAAPGRAAQRHRASGAGVR